ncbi:hypothetical protein V1506DRAFT_273337 [Lipomyces tetrasporus]
MLPATTPGVAKRTYSTLPQSSSVARQPSTKYTDNPSYIPSPTQPRTNQPASYGTYESGNPFADPPPRPERYYSHGSVPQRPYNSSNGSDPEKYTPRSRIFGMRRRSCVIIFIVAACLIAAIVVAATFNNVSHFWSNSSTNAQGQGATKTSSSASSSSVSAETETSHSASPTVFWGLHNNSTNDTYMYPNSTTSAFELPYTSSATAVPSSNITIPYF